MEQPKNGTSVRGMVECFTTTYDNKKNEQINKTTALSSKNSRINREYAAYSPTDKKNKFRTMMAQE